MPSERVQRQIDQLLDEAEQALRGGEWALGQTLLNRVLTFDPDNSDVQALLLIAERGLAAEAGSVRARAAPAPGPGNAGPAPTPAQFSTPGPQSFVNGRYKVESFLGEGGKKKVYLARDTVLARDVAFALIKTEGLDDVARERVSREGQAMGTLGAHPHIVTVFDLGEEPPLPGLGEGRGEGHGQPYMVTELMGGGDVEGVIEKAEGGKLPLEQALRIADEVCRGLEFAHSKGIIHRDLKPGNVWLTESYQPSAISHQHPAAAASTPVAKIGDFGLAVALDRSRLTQAGMMVGTVGYMPPEQATGGEVTPRSDLYSLGAMLYEMVTGRPPFIGDDAVAIIGQHLNMAPVSPTWHRPDCPPGLEALLLHLLEKDPAKRPASAAEVRAALDHIAQSVVHPSSPASLPQGERGDHASPAPTPDNPMYRRTFVGREPELRQLKAAFDAALSGQGSLAMVIGEPGIGKTSVCEQLATYVAVRGGKALVGHCYEEGSLSLPYLPFVEAMRSYVLQREPDGLAADLGSGAGDVARIVSEVRERLRIEASPVNLADAEAERYRLFQAVGGFLRNASLIQPLLIVLEDLHDADRGTLDLLVHLARTLSGSRLLLVGTYRDIEVDRAHPLSAALAELRRHAGFSRVVLRGLTADEVQRMLSQLSGQEVSWGLAEAVHRQTEGNPLFIQEVVRYLVEEGLIRREDGRWRRVSEETPLELGIPEGLRDVIGKRLSRLSGLTNQVLATAAVMGREFRLDVLQRVAGLGEEELYGALAEAKAVAVVEERSAPGGAVSYRFTHAFFRQTLYEETIAPRRIRLHQQVARALEAVYGRRLEEHAAELAEHYAYSSDPADLARAVSYGELAARRAMSVYAYGEAERHLEQALKVQEVLDPDDKTKRCDLLLALGEAILPGEDPGRVASGPAEQAFALAEPLHDMHRAARAAVLALEGLDRRQEGVGSGDIARARQPWVERADRSATAGTRERILADIHVGSVAITLTGPASGHPYLRRAAEAALKTDDQAAFFRATGLAIRQLRATQDRDLSQRIADAILTRPRRDAPSGDLGTCLYWLAFALLERGDREAAERAWLELKELAERTRDAGLRVSARMSDIARAFLDGRLEESNSLFNESRALAEELGIRPAAVFFLRPQSLIYLGSRKEIEALPEVVNPASRGQWALAAWCLAHLGRHDEAQELRERFGDLGSPADETANIFLAWLLESAVLGSDRELVRAVAPRLAEMARFPGVITSLLSWPRILGAAAALLGEREQARAYYEQAIEGCTTLRNRPELALTHLQYAELLLEEGGERGEAMRHLDVAIAELRDMKMQPFLERALRHKEMLKA